MNILIVDDEPLARRRLAGLLAHLGSHEIITANNGEQALSLVAEQHPDVVFLDIEMPVMDGMEAAQIISRDFPQTAIIFLTAHEQFALPAFDVKAVDYLLKPVASDRLQEALQRVEVSEQAYLSVKQGGRLLRVPVDNIICLQAEDKYVTAYLSDRHYLLDQSLIEIANCYRQFIRIHRSWLVNIHYLRGVDMDNNHSAVALLKHIDIRPPISRRQLTEVKKHI
ncbi:LytR/AlgR family response regulator transcription factor [Marinicella gelatinilytica]|uniref:LytR/AlgR family response regulator transcription factor n=1 Tax=Marinicella gelatinilytica TaxID=2996017 RepID=UPI002260F82E|nr:LytTR family DNA-binding domain-containing protein [Marinicella gelatinilytica]MCX7544929.1 LytTR family DNA-binding domain-containing protein [Marinicella gelatinilytica]